MHNVPGACRSLFEHITLPRKPTNTSLQHSHAEAKNLSVHRDRYTIVYISALLLNPQSWQRSFAIIIFNKHDLRLLEYNIQKILFIINLRCNTGFCYFRDVIKNVAAVMYYVHLFHILHPNPITWKQPSENRNLPQKYCCLTLRRRENTFYALNWHI